MRETAAMFPPGRITLLQLTRGILLLGGCLIVLLQKDKFLVKMMLSAA